MLGRLVVVVVDVVVDVEVAVRSVVRDEGLDCYFIKNKGKEIRRVNTVKDDRTNEDSDQQNIE